MTPPPDHSGPLARKTVLANGVRVLTERLDHVDSVSLGLWSASGSHNDPPGSEGVTHFLEHMLFKGTTTRSTLQIAEAIDDIGGNVNGVTDREDVCLYARTSSEQTEAALELLFDMMLNSVCAEEDVAREREVVLQEIGHLSDSAEDWMHELVPQTTWPDHPLGRPLLGTRESVGAIRCEALRDYLAEELQAAGRLLVAAAGRVDHDRIVKMTERFAARLTPGRPRQDQPGPQFHAQCRYFPQPGSQVHFCWVSPGVSRTDEARHAFAALDTLLGGGSSSRLFQEIRENRGLAYGIGSYLQAYRESGLFVIAAGTSPGNFELVLDLIGQEVKRLCEEGPTGEELARAKMQLRVGLALATESTGFRMQHIASSEIYTGRVVSFEDMVAGVERVSAEDVHQLACGSFEEGKQALVAIGPFDRDGRAR